MVVFVAHKIQGATYNYFETGHGKGEHDGAGACIKTALQREEMKFTSARLRDSASIVKWCASVMENKQQGNT